MGRGIDLARPHAPDHAAVLDDFKDQLLICFLRRLGGKLTLPVAEVDDTGGLLLAFKLDERGFYFELQKKQ